MEKKVAAPPATAGLLVQTDLGGLSARHRVRGSVQADKHKRTTSTMNG